jgi:hypothetical protein
MLMACAVVKPVPRSGIATGSGATQQRSTLLIVDNDNFAPGKQVRAVNAKPLVINRFPLPPVVARAQLCQPIGVGMMVQATALLPKK